MIDASDNPLYNDDDCANELCKLFAKISSSNKSNFECVAESENDQLTQEIQVSEIENELKNINIHKAPRPDNISPFILKNGVSWLTKVLHKLFNEI